MSYGLECQYALFVDESAATPRYVVAIEGGDSNLYENKSGRRVRQGDVAMLGLEATILKRAVYYAAACDGGSLKPIGRDGTAESYIARIRRLLTTKNTPSWTGFWYADLRLPIGHPAVAHARSLGLPIHEATEYGQPIYEIDIPIDRRELVFDFAEMFPDLPSWTLAKVGGLRAS